MNTTMPTITDAVVPVLEALGRELLRWRTDDAARALHSKKDFKTEADRRADAFIKERLATLFPGVPVWSEEDAAHRDARPDVYWLIDPIDGTASWYGGYAGFVTQAAFIVAGVAQAGAIHCPATNQTWTARTGEGAWCNGGRLPRLAPGERCLIVDNTPQPHGIAAELVRALPATGYRESGSLGLKAALVAQGTVDLFVKRVPVRDWDMAPAAVLLAETGGLLVLPDGQPFNFDGAMEKPGVIVARDAGLCARAVSVLAGLPAS
jgi:3'(2'), 5'-bisphosphate nucleotidase